MTPAPRTGRVPPLPPEERRAAIIHATLPLVRARGFAVTTREIASAAGIAEGTIFRVFEDKDELFCAVVDAAFDPTPLEGALAELADIVDLRARLTAGVNVLLQGMSEVWRILVAVRTSVGAAPQSGATGGQRRAGSGVRVGGRQTMHHERQQRIAAAVARLFAPDESLLRVSPTTAARYLNALVTGASHPAYAGADQHADPLTPDEIVAALLDGVLDADPPNASVMNLAAARATRTRTSARKPTRKPPRKDG